VRVLEGDIQRESERRENDREREKMIKRERERERCVSKSFESE